jgi:hypothetical protein
MAVPGATWPAAKLYLFNQLRASAVCAPPVVVAYNDPLGDLEDDVVVVGKVSRLVEPLALVGSYGAGAFAERYTVQVTVSSFRGGDNPVATDLQCAALVDAVVSVVRTDPTLGGVVLQAKPGNHDPDGRWVTDSDGQNVMGYLTECVVPVECYVNI